MLISEIARRNASFGALVASLPLVSLLGMIWLWHDTHDIERIGAHSSATFWYVLPSLPMFLVIPWLMHRGIPFYPTLLLACMLTSALYFITVWITRFLKVSL